MNTELNIGKTKMQKEDAGCFRINTDVSQNDIKELDVEYNDIFKLAPDGIIKADLKGFVTACNDSFTRMTGYCKRRRSGGFGFGGCLTPALAQITKSCKTSDPG